MNEKSDIYKLFILIVSVLTTSPILTLLIGKYFGDISGYIFGGVVGAGVGVFFGWIVIGFYEMHEKVKKSLGTQKKINKHDLKMSYLLIISVLTFSVIGSFVFGKLSKEIGSYFFGGMVGLGIGLMFSLMLITFFQAHFKLQLEKIAE